MKIAVSTNSGGLEDTVSPVFARAPTFTIVDIEDGKIKDARVMQNPAAMAGGGAGIQAAQMLVNEGVQMVIAGNFGPNASGILAQYGIAMITSAGTKVEDAVKSAEKGSPTSSAEVAPTAPVYNYPSQPYGYGRGAGMGLGRGMGYGRGAGWGGRGYRWMYYATGLPGWQRLGYSPGWVGVTPDGLPPYLQGYPGVPNPVSIGVWPAAPTKEDEIKALEEQKKAIEKRLKELRDEK